MNLERLADLDFADKRVTVVGLGVEGVDTVRYLASRGAEVTVSDAKPRERLADRVRQVADLRVHLSLGENDPVAVRDADAVFLSQGVPLDLPGLDEARGQGVPVWSMLTLFMELCPGPVVGSPGSSGKTTTTTLVGEMFRADEKPVFSGGNIGVGLLDHLPEVRAHAWAVLEVSHTQLQMASRCPHVACLLNVTPNHLDRFSWDQYRDLKRNIFRFQTAEDVAVFGYDDPESRAMASEARAARVWFSLGEEIPGDGVYVRDGLARYRRGRYDQPLFPLASLRLGGRPHRQNPLAAAPGAPRRPRPRAGAGAPAGRHSVLHRRYPPPSGASSGRNPLLSGAASAPSRRPRKTATVGGVGPRGAAAMPRGDPVRRVGAEARGGFAQGQRRRRSQGGPHSPGRRAAGGGGSRAGRRPARRPPPPFARLHQLPRP